VVNAGKEERRSCHQNQVGLSLVQNQEQEEKEEEEMI
jgi:hypothetical protein